MPPSSDRRVPKSALQNFFLCDFPRSQIRSRSLSARHTSNTPLVRRIMSQTKLRYTAIFSFDGTSHLHCSLRPSTQAPTATSFPPRTNTLSSKSKPSFKQRSVPQAPQVLDAVKASVPKLFGCPGALLTSSSKGFPPSRLWLAVQRSLNRLLNLQHRRTGLSVRCGLSATP